jgi:hypothetical protein
MQAATTHPHMADTHSTTHGETIVFYEVRRSCAGQFYLCAGQFYLYKLDHRRFISMPFSIREASDPPGAVARPATWKRQRWHRR